MINWIKIIAETEFPKDCYILLIETNFKDEYLQIIKYDGELFRAINSDDEDDDDYFRVRQITWFTHYAIINLPTEKN